MNINDFARKVALLERGSKEVSIAQVKEIMNVINTLTGGILYAAIRLMKK